MSETGQSCTPEKPCGDCWECGPISVQEAKRLHEQAEKLSVKTLRRIGELRLRAGWISAATKKQIVRGFREKLQRIIDGEVVAPEPEELE